jgi:hypothetical protein
MTQGSCVAVAMLLVTLGGPALLGLRGVIQNRRVNGNGCGRLDASHARLVNDWSIYEKEPGWRR